MALRPPKKKSKNAGMGKQLQDYIKKNPGRTTSRLLKLARSRKPTGRLNIDDFANARDSGTLAGTGFGKKTQSKGPAGKVIKKKNGGKVARPEDVFIIGPDGKRKRKPVGDPRLRASDVFIMGPDGKRKRKPAVPKKEQRMKRR